MFRKTTCAAVRGALIAAHLAGASASPAQAPDRADSLVAHALAVNPRLRMAKAQAAAARARIAPAGAWSDPMLMGGIQNLPLSRESTGTPAIAAGTDPMTMTMVGVSQTVPYPGKASLRRAVARREAEAAEARAERIRREVEREVRDAYVDLVAARLLLGIVERQQIVAGGVLPAAEARYVSGSVTQADVLKARTESALLAGERNTAVQEERAALARLNAVLDQPGGTPGFADSVPERALADHRRPPPALDSLNAIGLQTNPRLLERRAFISAQTAQAALAKREYLPDFDVGVQYGRRVGRPDMMTATIGVPLPVQRGRKQTAMARAAQFDLAAAEAELRAEENELRSEVARTHAAVERHRANLDLLDRAILPQARATFASASASYQSGRSELLAVLDAMRALFAVETMRVRTLADLAKSVAELQSLAGEEVVR